MVHGSHIFPMPNSPENLLRDLARGGAFQLKVFRQPGAHTEVVDLRCLDDLKQQIDWINTWSLSENVGLISPMK